MCGNTTKKGQRAVCANRWLNGREIFVSRSNIHLALTVCIGAKYFSADIHMVQIRTEMYNSYIKQKTTKQAALNVTYTDVTVMVHRPGHTNYHSIPLLSQCRCCHLSPSLWTCWWAVGCCGWPATWTCREVRAYHLVSRRLQGINKDLSLNIRE